MRTSLWTAVLLCALVGFAGPLRADFLYMKDGRKIEGRIVGKTADSYVVEIASGSKKITALYAMSDVREVEINPVTSNDRLMTQYNGKLVEASKKGADGYRDLAHWCAQHEELSSERLSAWRAVLGLLPDDDEAHGALGQVKDPQGNWMSIEEKMTAAGFIRRGNTWVRDPNRAPRGGGVAGVAGAGGVAEAVPAGARSNSVMQRSGFNQLYGGATGYTASVSGPGVQNGTVFYGRTGYPYLEAYDAAGVGIYVPLYSYPGSYYLSLPPATYSGPNFWGNNSALSLADRGLTGSFFPVAPATTTVTQNGTTFTVPAVAPMDPSVNSQGYDQHGIRSGQPYREPVPPTEYTPTGTGNLQIVDSTGVVTYQGANFESHNAMGYDQHGIQVSPPKVVQDASVGVVAPSGYNSYGVYSGAGAAAGVGPYVTNGAGYTTYGGYTGPVYAPVGVFLVNGAGYTTGGTIAPFYSSAPGGAYSRYSNFEVDLYSRAGSSSYRVGLNGGGVNADLSGRSGNWSWSATIH